MNDNVNEMDIAVSDTGNPVMTPAVCIAACAGAALLGVGVLIGRLTKRNPAPIVINPSKCRSKQRSAAVIVCSDLE